MIHRNNDSGNNKDVTNEQEESNMAKNYHDSNSMGNSEKAYESKKNSYSKNASRNAYDKNAAGKNAARNKMSSSYNCNDEMDNE